MNTQLSLEKATPSAPVRSPLDQALSVRDLRKSYGAHQVLRQVSFEVSTGEVFALLGPNGSGKSTLVRILTTLICADGGSATIFGHRVDSEPKRVRELISMTGQYASVDEELTGLENLVMIGQLLGFGRAEARRRADELLSDFELTEAAGRRVARYSGGMRRRLDLAASLVSLPPLIFLDEPTTGMDAHSRSALWAVIKRLVDKEKAIFLTTQYLEEADVLADRVAVLDGGVIVAEGTPAALKERVGGESVRLTLDNGNTLEEVTEGNPERLRLLLNRLKSEGQTVRSLTFHPPTLDDAFLALTGRVTSDNAIRKESQQ